MEKEEGGGGGSPWTTDRQLFCRGIYTQIGDLERNEGCILNKLLLALLEILLTDTSIDEKRI